MNRPVISPSISNTSSPDHTLEVMQRRIQMAEDETKKLVDQLSDYGFSKEKYEKKDTATGRIDPVSPFKSTLSSSPQVEVLKKNYEQMVSRVCRAESTIQSMKLAMVSLQAERELNNLSRGNSASIPRDAYDKEIKTLEKELKQCRRDLESALHEKNELRENFKKVQSTLDKTDAFNAEVKVKLEESKSVKEKLNKRVTEIKEELVHERELRSSLESSHNSLLSRVNDMETLVDTERHQVRLLDAECDALKKESGATKQKYNEEHRLRMQLETLVAQFQEDTSNSDATIATLTTNKKNLESDLTLLKKENKELRQQFESLRASYEKLKNAHEKIASEHKRTSEELRAATVDNKVLVSQQKDAIQRERQVMAAKLAEKDRTLDEAKNILAREVQEEKEKSQLVKRESKNLKGEVNRLNEELQAARNKLNLKKQEVGLKMVELEERIDEVTRERDTALKEKSQILDEIEQTVSGFTLERDRIIKQLEKAQAEIETLQQKRGILEQESQKQLDRILELQNQQKSQHQIEDTMKDMIDAKNKLAYEKGALQSRVEQLQKEASKADSLKMQLEQVKRENAGMQNSYNKVSSELQKYKLDVQTLKGQLREGQLKIDSRDEDLRTVMSSREEALREVEKLVHHTEAMERNNRQKIEAIQKSFNDARANNMKLSSTMDSLMSSHIELQSTLETMQTELGRRDVELQAALRDKNHAQQAAQRFQSEVAALENKIEGLENNEVRELRPLREALKSAKEEIREISQQLERVTKANKKLQNTAEKLQMELGKKDVELEKLEKEKENDNKDKHFEVEDLQERLEEIAIKARNEMQDIRSKHKNQTSMLKKELEEVISTCCTLREENHSLENRFKEQQHELEKAKSRMKGLKSQLTQARKQHEVKEGEEEAAKSKMENFKTELNRLEKVKAEYVRKNKEQSKTIEEFVSKVTVLQHELTSLIDAQKAATLACTEKDKQLERERNARKDLERRLKKALSREKELETEKQETEQKLNYANNESEQVSESLKEAHMWFKSKFDDLQAELTRSKKLQNALERENREQQKKLKEDKRQWDEQTQKAREVLRNSRNAVSQLAGEVAENLWETKGMKHALQAERDYNSMTSQKLQQLQESTARQMEDLAFEVNKLRESTR